eukprot:TRINITY_DN45752_c0_g1_i1.p1 TRINITY_DN45752_c0_g1~~TRINITY_DN45752_c0_g1_i1.p1  ORF type:complete len:542 (-),score=103.22 TRINITY_DN45752_c0_g1_i1:20-1615(-)
MVARATALRLCQSLICPASRRQSALCQVATCWQPVRRSSPGCMHVRTCANVALLRSEDSKPGFCAPDRTSAPSSDQEDAELLEALQSAIELLGDDANAEHPLVEARNRLASASRDKAALLKRNWTDEMFQGGNDANEERVAEIEAMMASTLGRVQGGLHDSENLGNALDLVGVYMKNYQLDKANAVLARSGPFVSERGGVWMVKWLNHISTVRMKQGRHLEALEMLYELEMYSPYNSQEAPEFFETLYRNLAWALKALGRIDEAAIYFARMATMSQTTKGHLDWFDCWDIGKLAATRAYQASDMEAFYRGRDLIEQALSMHVKAEPDDLVMRAKVHDSLAECFLVVKEYADAEKHYSAAYDLLQQTVGRQSPLFGKQARHAANLHIAQGQYEDALPFLGEALAVEASKDAVNVLELMELVDTLVNAQQRSSSEAVERVESNHQSLKQLQSNLKRRGLDSSREYAVLCHKASLLYLHEGRTNPDALRRARRLAKTSVRILRFQAGDKDAGDWLKMAELQLRMLDSARRSRAV